LTTQHRPGSGPLSLPLGCRPARLPAPLPPGPRGLRLPHQDKAQSVPPKPPPAPCPDAQPRSVVPRPATSAEKSTPPGPDDRRGAADAPHRAKHARPRADLSCRQSQPVAPRRLWHQSLPRCLAQIRQRRARAKRGGIEGFRRRSRDPARQRGRVTLSAVASGWAVGMPAMLLHGGALDQHQVQKPPQLVQRVYVQYDCSLSDIQG
jgi:hypothetical protein